MMGLSKAREMLLAGRPLPAAAALESGLISEVTSEAELDDKGLALAKDMARAAPDALRITKRTLDASLEAATYDAAMEIEERGQMLMIRGRHRRRCHARRADLRQPSTQRASIARFDTKSSASQALNIGTTNTNQ